jgi:hypothetical protein
MSTTWTDINDSQNASWDDVQSFGYLLLESGLNNFLVQETASAPFNKFVINVTPVSQTWSAVNDSQSATWAAVNVST